MIPMTSRSFHIINQSNMDQNSKFFQTKISKQMIPMRQKHAFFATGSRQNLVNCPSFPAINRSECFSDSCKLKMFDHKAQPSKEKIIQNNFSLRRNQMPPFKRQERIFNDTEEETTNIRKRIKNINHSVHKSTNRDSNTSSDLVSWKPNTSVNTNHTPPNSETTFSAVPMTPHSVLRNYRSQLTSLEQEEIFDYHDIWFLGLHAMKTEAVQGTSPNNGYDDDSGAYIKVNHDHLAFRYESLETLGKGSFGQVVRAIDHQTGQEVAVKIIRNKKRFHQQAEIEVSILNHLKRKDKCSEKGINVIHILDDFIFRSHHCIVFELFGENLYDVIKRNNFRGFSLAVVQKMAYTLFRCLSVLRRESIIHCDIKPENILVRSKNCYEIKLIDFGSSCYANQRVYTYIQSRFYRSPEVILGIPYTTQIDLWSLGCVLPELITGRPLLPGENEMDQLACAIEVFGYPPKTLMDEATRKRLFFDNAGEARSLTNSKGKRRIPNSQTLQSIMRSHTDPRFIDLITRSLEWDPKKRITPDDALEHPWFNDIKEELITPQDGITSELKISPRRSRNKGFLKGKEIIKALSESNSHRTDKENLPPLVTLKENIGRESLAVNKRIEFPSLYR